MLEITVPAREMFDNIKQEFIYSEEQTLQLEHSLVSLSKWESKWCKPFLSKQEKTKEEIRDYIRCMTLNSVEDSTVYMRFTQENVDKIDEYISAPMTATVFYDDNEGKGNNRKQITAERIYCWMFALNIPMECQYWHLNRLLALIRFCNNENQPDKKMTKGEIMRRNAKLNAARRKQYNSKG